MKVCQKLFLVLVPFLFFSACASKERQMAQVDEMIATFRQHLPQAEECYKTARQKAPGLKGKLTLQWTVDDQARVREVKVTGSQLQSPEFENCLVDLVKSISFPKTRPLTRSKVEYELEFHSETVPRS